MGKQKKKPKFAAGVEHPLEKSASKQDIKKNNYTKVTQLSYDEVNPG